MPLSPRHRSLSAAFEALYQQHFAFVWRVVWRAGVSESDVDDVCQEVFVTAHRRFEDLEPGAERAFLFGVARRAAANHRRGTQRRRRKIAALPEPCPERALDEQLVDRRQIRRLERAIDSLPSQRREVYVLMELEGLSAPEVAASLGCKLNTVYSRLRRARRELAAVLQPRARERPCPPASEPRLAHD